jgi:hypothetical protein
VTNQPEAAIELEKLFSQDAPETSKALSQELSLFIGRLVKDDFKSHFNKGLASSMVRKQRCRSCQREM